MPVDVTVVGSINTDLAFYVTNFPRAGETTVGSNFSMNYGGKGANQCVAARKLGASSSIISRVGNDFFGDQYIKYLQNIGVNTDGIKRSFTTHSGVALILVETEIGENRITIVPGTNLELALEDIDNAYKQSLISQKVVLCQFEANAKSTLYTLETAKSRGITTILDPAPAPSKDSPFHPLLPFLFKASKFMCPNEIEAEMLTGLPIPEALKKPTSTAPEIGEATSPWIRRFRESGVECPIVTLAANGIVALLPLGEECSPLETCDVSILNNPLDWDGHYFIHIQAPRIDTPTDTTGAGDSFAGCLAYYLACHPELRLVEKLRRSVWIASLSVLQPGTQSSFPGRLDLPCGLFTSDTFEWP